MSHRLIFTIACTLLLLTALASADEPVAPAKPTAERVKLVRQMYSKVPCEILGFAAPTKQFVAAQKDGLGVTLLLEDANDKKLTILLLQKLGETPDALLLTSGHLATRGPEESAVYGLLLRLSAKPPEKTTEQQLQLMDTILAVLDQRFAGAMPNTAKGAKK